ncbi:putative UDP-glucoronosyl and UDP-glucosyl transferase [Tricladium varicosporioides]|nr:putative UDP-glucoronosyl and UDP-glucosyl transferase [Hymenoscyphus varicosporioides]
MPTNQECPESSARRHNPERRPILFFTSSDYGQANVILAVCYELLQRQYEVHIVSFAPLKNRVLELNQMTTKGQAVFHTVPGLTSMEALALNKEFVGPFPPGVQGALRTYEITLPAMATIWTESEYMIAYESCLDILKSVDPGVIVIDPLMSQALDACITLSRKYIVLSPNTFQDILRKQQPFFSQLARYPAISSGFRYPVPWLMVWANIYLKIRLIIVLLTSRKIKSIRSWRQSHNLTPLPQVFDIWQNENHYLVPATTATDFPCRQASNVTGCGPILLPVPLLSDVDPSLLVWLQRGPTVLINLGSHIRMDATVILEFSLALKALFAIRPDIQILWKLKRSGGIALQEESLTESQILSRSEVNSMTQKENSNDPLFPIEAEISADKVRVLEWISVSPLSILNTGNIVCSVHHGGSNSFHEAVSVGVPQIVLPCWLDTFEFANRVEYLGIGLHGSRTSAPLVEAKELSSALLLVLGDNNKATAMKLKAKELSEISGRVGGRVKACEKIIEILGSS